MAKLAVHWPGLVLRDTTNRIYNEFIARKSLYYLISKGSVFLQARKVKVIFCFTSASFKINSHLNILQRDSSKGRSLILFIQTSVIVSDMRTLDAAIDGTLKRRFTDCYWHFVTLRSILHVFQG